MNGREHLTTSVNENVMYKARCETNITDDERRELIYGELELVNQALETKTMETQYKSKAFRIINGLFGALILVCSAVIVGLQAVSTCLNIPVIVLSSIIFVIQGSNDLFHLGSQGFSYKQGSIRLKRVKRQVRSIMLWFHTFSTEQIMTMTNQFWNEYDDVDVDLYKMSVPEQTKYENGFSVVPNETTSNNQRSPSDKDASSPHVHIHMDGGTPILSSMRLREGQPNTPTRGYDSPLPTIDIQRTPNMPVDLSV